MESDPQREREIRAARNQSLFRAVNEKARELNVTFAALTNTFMIACECADVNCMETLEILPHEYLAVRAEPRQFAVLPGHVYPDVDSVVRETRGYVVVEKEGAAAEVAEALDQLVGETKQGRARFKRTVDSARVEDGGGTAGFAG